MHDNKTVAHEIYLEAKKIVEEYESKQLDKHNVSGAKRKLVCPKCGSGEEKHKRMGAHVLCVPCDYEWNWS